MFATGDLVDVGLGVVLQLRQQVISEDDFILMFWRPLVGQPLKMVMDGDVVPDIHLACLTDIREIVRADF